MIERQEMAARIDIEETIEVGEALVLTSESPTSSYAVVFEDDEDTGYFYAVSMVDSDFRILDAMHIYNVKNVADRNKPSRVTIAWSEDGMKAALLINDYAHAIFNFEEKQGYCRTNFPTPGTGWKGHEWSDEALALFD